MNESHTHKCHNCESEFDFEFDYCPSCGQKNTDGKITDKLVSTMVVCDSSFYRILGQYVPVSQPFLYFFGY